MAQSRTKTKKSAPKAPTVSAARKRLAGGTGFWETLTPSQQKALLNWDGPEVHGPRKTNGLAKAAKRKTIAVPATSATRSSKSPESADDFWATFTPAQKEALRNLGEPDAHGPQKTPRPKSRSVEKRAPTRAEARERLSKGLGWIENLTEDQKKILDSIEGPAFLGRPRKPKRRG
jgi:hypothetical protein